jgi:hypothetical protein
MGTPKANGLPDGWETKRIDELGEVRGGRQRSPHLTAGQLRPYLRVANVLAGRIDTSDVLEMKFTDEEYELYRLQPGDVLLNEGQSLELVGRSAIYQGDPPDCCFQNTLVRFRPHVGNDPRFAHYLFEQLRGEGRFALIATKTTSIAHLGISRFASLRVPCPPPNVQRCIVTILDAWTRAEDAAARLIVAKAKLRDALHRRLTAGNDRPRRKMSDLVERARVPVEVDPAAEYREIGIRSHGKGVFHKETVLGSDLGEKDVFAVQPDCLTFNIVFAWEQAVAITTAAEAGMVASHRFPMYRPRNGDLSVRYALYYLLSPEGKTALELGSPGGAGRNRTLSQDAFQKIAIPVPPMAEQERIVAVLTAADRELRLLRSQLDAVRRQKQELMRRLLTGELPVPASAG